MRDFLRILAIFSPFVALAQQDPQFSQYMMNPFIWNPSYPALNKEVAMSLHHRSQWLGYNTSNDADNIQPPSTQLFTISSPINKIRSGLGLGMLNDKLGPLTTSNLFLAYSYRLQLGQGKIAAGIAIGMASSRINTDLWRPETQGDPTLSLANTGTISQIKPNYRFGLAYATEKLDIGLSSNNIFTPVFTYNSGNIASRIERHYYLQGSYKVFLSENVTLQPSSILKLTRNIVSAEVSNIAFVKIFWFGLAYRTSDAATFLAGISLLSDKSLKFGYNLDLSVINKSAKALTSHEIFLSYNFASILDNRRPIVRSPRFRF